MPKLIPEKNPIDLFSQWYNEVLNSSYKEPSAMTLATCSKECIPSARVVLLKKYSKEGFIFFTNVNSRKGKELTENPKAALVFHWAGFSKQVRIEGNVKFLSNEEADEYFSSRTHESQISAWCSKQSSPLENWKDFEHAIEQNEKEFYDKKTSYPDFKTPSPDFWVGFCVVPKAIEFWQEGEYRRHIRFRYTLNDESNWKVEQLYP
ncbi:MAG: Pyridoxine/pyridoxamine 5'-phosphate oxidase [Wolbachia endosymbiont of Ctenocephalides orientis wCori]|nr:MAG: Pyridoxine/pyridoxamine 5'-phosphate oxidase [Wolbachia endosymbiont of Ctenocephalides orientis wCori]